MRWTGGQNVAVVVGEDDSDAKCQITREITQEMIDSESDILFSFFFENVNVWLQLKKKKITRRPCSKVPRRKPMRSVHKNYL